VVGLIHDIPSCAELLQRMVSECRQQLLAASELC
jgi:nitronate monooxygenase